MDPKEKKSQSGSLENGIMNDLFQKKNVSCPIYKDVPVTR